MKKTRILVVEDHPFCRGGIINWINRQEDFECCGEADTVAGAWKLIEELKPDLVLLDLMLRDGDGLDMLQQLAKTHPTVRVLVLSQRDQYFYAHRALKAGARGYLMKAEASEAVMEAIRTIIAGKVYINPKLAPALLENLFPDPANEDKFHRLSDRELQVFELLGKRLGSAEVAERLKISQKTVDTYRENLKAKLGLPDAAALEKHARHWVEFGNLPAKP